MAIGEYLAVFFMVVASVLGYAAAYNQIDTDNRSKLARKHNLKHVSEELPPLFYICCVLIALRLAYGATQDDLFYWTLINIQVTIMLYNNLLVSSLLEFVIIQVVGGMTFATIGAIHPSAMIFFLIASFIIYSERWYGTLFNRSHPLYLAPPIIIGSLFWGLMYFTYDQTLTVPITVANYLAFLYAYFALWRYDESLHKNQRMVAKLTHEVQYDALTRIRNWATFQHDFTHAYSKTENQQLALAVFDIDHFKNINDTYGHLVGNQVLMMVASQTEKALQRQDQHFHLYRTGGEEFAFFLPHTTRQQAGKIVSTCQQLLQQMDVRFSDGQFNITASFGVAMVQSQDGSSTAVFKRADRYLYQSKNNGRDQVTVEGYPYPRDQKTA